MGYVECCLHLRGIHRNRSDTSIINSCVGQCNSYCSSFSSLHQALGFKATFIGRWSTGQESCISLFSLQKALRDLLISTCDHQKQAQVWFWPFSHAFLSRSFSQTAFENGYLFEACPGNIVDANYALSALSSAILFIY